MCELERRGCDKHTHTQIKAALSTALVRGSQGCDFLKTNVKRETTPRCSICSTDKSKQTEQCGSCMVCVCVCVCDFHTRRPQSSHQHKQRCEGSKQSGQEVCRHSFSVSFLSHDLMHCLHPIMQSACRTSTVNRFRFRTQFLHQFTIFYIFFYCTKSKQNSPKTDSC